MQPNVPIRWVPRVATSSSWSQVQSPAWDGLIELAGSHPGRNRATRSARLRRAAQPAPVPTVLDPELAVRVAVDGLTTPVNLAFLGKNDLLVLEKNTGRVRRIRIVNGVPQVTVVLDLVVNFASERGLLGIALHPQFPKDRGVYLYWTSAAPLPPPENPFVPVVERSPNQPELDDPNQPRDVGGDARRPLLGNRVDRFEWNGSRLIYDSNLLTLRSFQHDGAPLPPGQNDAAQTPAGNHDGGVIRFGPDKKLYVFFGDQGRRGWMQNLLFGPTPPTDDDQFGGPDPDKRPPLGCNASARRRRFGAQEQSVLQGGRDTQPARVSTGRGKPPKVFSYGHRNSFGLGRVLRSVTLLLLNWDPGVDSARIGTSADFVSASGSAPIDAQPA